MLKMSTIPVSTDLTFRTLSASKLNVATVDSNFATVQAQMQASSNSILYLGPSASNTGFTISNSNLASPPSTRFNVRITPNSFNSLGGRINMVDGTTFSFKFSATSSGNLGSQSQTFEWWTNLNNSYSNKILSLSDTNATSNFWEYKIHAMSYSLSNWNVTATKIQGPTSVSLFSNRTYTLSYRTSEPPNTSYIYSWSASISMTNSNNFFFNLNSMVPNTISTSDYLLKINSTIVQFIGVTGVSTQVNPQFGINLLADGEVTASATFSGTYSQNFRYRLRPNNLMVDGNAIMSLSGTTFSTWGGITFSSSTSSRIAIFLTYQSFPSLGTGLEEIE